MEAACPQSHHCKDPNSVASESIPNIHVYACVECHHSSCSLHSSLNSSSRSTLTVSIVASDAHPRLQGMTRAGYTTRIGLARGVPTPPCARKKARRSFARPDDTMCRRECSQVDGCLVKLAKLRRRSVDAADTC